MSQFSYQLIKNSDNPTRLIVFLHGYNSEISDILPYVQILNHRLENTVIVMPIGQSESSRNPLKKRWYPLRDIDPTKKRRDTKTSVVEIFDIYNRAGERMSSVSKCINEFISDLQKEYNIDDTHTYLMGFSQGAMLAIYAGLVRKKKIGGIFSFAGIISGKDKLDKEVKSHPPVYLFHGKEDISVQYKTLAYTKKWLDMHEIYWEAIEYENTDHKLINDEMIDTAEIINR